MVRMRFVSCVALACCLAMAGCGGAPVASESEGGKVSVNGVVMDEVPDEYRSDSGVSDGGVSGSASSGAPVAGIRPADDDAIVGTWYPVSYCSNGVCSTLSSGQLDLRADGTCVLDDGQGSRNEATWSGGVIHKRTVSDMVLEVGPDGLLYGHDVDGWDDYTVFSRVGGGSGSLSVSTDSGIPDTSGGKVSVNGIVMDEVPEGLR